MCKSADEVSWEKRVEGLSRRKDFLGGQVLFVEPYPEDLSGPDKLDYNRDCVVKIDGQKYLAPYEQ